jgi:ferredoxin
VHGVHAVGLTCAGVMFFHDVGESGIRLCIACGACRFVCHIGNIVPAYVPTRGWGLRPPPPHPPPAILCTVIGMHGMHMCVTCWAC